MMLNSFWRRCFLFCTIIALVLTIDLLTKWYAGYIFHTENISNCPYPQCSKGLLSFGAPCLSTLEPSRIVELRVPIIEGFFYIHLLNNTGAAWSFLSGNNSFFILFNVIFLCVAFYYMLRKNSHIELLSFIAFSIIIGGAMGNFYDRLVHNSVRDFLSFFIPLPDGAAYAYPVFNGADSFIFIGAVLYFFDQFILAKFRAKQAQKTSQDITETPVNHIEK